MATLDKYLNQKINSYGVKYRLGQGAFATIYAAEDLKKSTSQKKFMVALKVPLNKDENYKKNMAEAELLKGLNHPNIARCYSVEMDKRENIFFFVMEIIKGKDLGEIINLAGGPMPANQVEHIGRQLLDACKYMKKNFIVHRDMKPDNVVLLDEPYGWAKIMDFGLAINTLDWDGKGAQAGSLLFMAPEQCKGKPEPASDVWGVGVIMYKMLTGKSPFLAASEPEIRTRILEDEPTPILEMLPNADPKVVVLIEKCLIKDPKERYCFEDMEDGFRPYGDGE
ncbi:serine/threonine protein kinase [bacterium]|nr:serine/threonine protein kinase [bacterium]MBU1024410.1 serine/threonine protein kinase [bacterium]